MVEGVYRPLDFETVRVNRQGKIIQKIPGSGAVLSPGLGSGGAVGHGANPWRNIFRDGDRERRKLSACVKSMMSEWFRRESPQHSVQVSPFFLGKPPSPQDQWRTVVTQVGTIVRDLDPDPSNFKGGNRPVEWVSWYDAVEWCARLSKLTGKEYRLPSEAEWEYACRCGNDDPLCLWGSYHYTTWPIMMGTTPLLRKPGAYREETTPVASFPPNGFGLYDLHGNVWEWCFDPFVENYQGAPRDGGVWDETIKDNENRYQNPSANLKVLLEESDKSYVLRGGSWGLEPDLLPFGLPPRLRARQLRLRPGVSGLSRWRRTLIALYPLALLHSALFPLYPLKSDRRELFLFFFDERTTDYPENLRLDSVVCPHFEPIAQNT